MPLNSVQSIDKSQISNNKSTLFFTTHKSGSVFASKTIKIMLEQENLAFVDLYGYFDMSDFQSLKYIDLMAKEDLERLSRAFYPFGYVYTPLRHAGISRVIQNIDQFNNIFMLRNPKDVVISSYFSFGFTHEKPINKNKLSSFQNEQKTIQNLSLEEYIFERTYLWKKLFTDYIDLINSHQYFLILKFEDMVSDFNFWLTTLESFFKIKLDLKSKDRIIDLHHRYYRKRRKTQNIELSRNVQNYLEYEFHDVLKFFNY